MQSGLSLLLEHSLPMQFGLVTCSTSMTVESLTLEAPIRCTRTGIGVNEAA